MMEYIKVTMSKEVVIPKEQWEGMNYNQRNEWLNHNGSNQNAVDGDWEITDSSAEDYQSFVNNKELYCAECDIPLYMDTAATTALDCHGDGTCQKCSGSKTAEAS